MEAREFIRDILVHEAGMREEYVEGMTPSELAWRAGPQANHSIWIIWHMARVEDFWVQFFIQKKLEIWEAEKWCAKFGLPARDNGFEHTAEKVSSFPALHLEDLMDYWRTVRKGTMDFVDALNPQALEVVPREKRPEMSVQAILNQIIGEFYQHLGHLDYIKGLMGKTRSRAI